ncbi:MAG: hypothetical protein ACI39F_04420 [Acutalibacteraceae bacterium]
MILFVGALEKGFYCEEVAKKIDENVEFTGYTPHIDAVEERILKDKYKHIIFDVEQFIDDFEYIADTIIKYQNVTNSNIIISAIGYNTKSEIIQSFLKRGITNFVMNNTLAKQYEELEFCFQNKNAPIEDTALNVVDEDTSPDLPAQEKTINSYRTIAVAGCCSRIGTTTQAMQIIKYLTLMGYKACYIEMNNNEYVRKIAEYFTDATENGDYDFIEYEKIKMYDKKENIAEILQQDFDFFVYDFGSFTDRAFNTISFAEKNIKLVVCGTKASEIDYTNAVIQRTYNTDCYYLFNFCHHNERKDVLEMMSDKASKTIFLPYSPDPFTYNTASNNLYKNIDFDKALDVPKKAKKKRFFGRK